MQFRRFLLKNYQKIILAGIFIFAAFLFTYRLTSNPPGFHIDEAGFLYEAWHILETGGYSSNGEYLPRSISIDNKIRGYSGSLIYSLIPLVAVLGLNEFTMRLSTVLISLLMMIVLYKVLINRVGFLATSAALLWWPLTSWVWLHSRIGIEYLHFSFLYFCTVLIFHRFLTEKVTLRLLALFTVVYVMLFFTYSPGKMLAGIFWLAGFCTLAARRTHLYTLIIYSLLGSMPFLLALPYILDGSFFYRTSELFLYCPGYERFCILRSVIWHINPDSYFGNTYIPPDYLVLTHSIVGTSLLPRVLMLFFTAGVMIVWWRMFKGSAFAGAIVFGMVMAIIPTSFTIRGFDSQRSIGLLPLLFVCLGFGFQWFFEWVKQQGKHHLTASVVLFLAVSGVFGSYELYRFYQYEFYPQVAVQHGWQYGFRPAMDYIEENVPKDAQIVLTDTFTYNTWYYPQFFDPENKYPYLRTGRRQCYTNDSSNPEQEQYYIFRYEELAEFDQGLIPVHDVYYPNKRDVVLRILKAP